MKYIGIKVWIAILVLNGIVLWTASEAVSEDNTCSIKTQVAGLFVNVYDVDPDARPQNLIWQGKMERNQAVELESNWGRFYFNYSADPKSMDSMVSGVVHFCRNGEVVNIP